MPCHVLSTMLLHPGEQERVILVHARVQKH